MHDDLNEAYGDNEIGQSDFTDVVLKSDELDLELFVMTTNDVGSTEEEVIQASRFKEQLVRKRIEKHLDTGLLKERSGRLFSECEKIANQEKLCLLSNRVSLLMNHRLDRRKLIVVDLETMTDDEYDTLIDDANKFVANHFKKMKSKRLPGSKPRFINFNIGTL